MRPRQVIALLALTGAFVALYLTLYKLGAIGELTCAVGNCETVNTSRWATLLGLPVAAWGLGAYMMLFVLAMTGLRDGLHASRTISWMLVALSGGGVLFSMWLTYLELFVFHAICLWCVTSATLITLTFLAALADLKATVASSPATRTDP
jgi:uncharacterized membrane protein